MIFTNTIKLSELKTISSGTDAGLQTTRKGIQRGTHAFHWHFFPCFQKAFFQRLDRVMIFRSLGLQVEPERVVHRVEVRAVRRPFIRADKARTLVAIPVLYDLRFMRWCQILLENERLVLEDCRTPGNQRLVRNFFQVYFRVHFLFFF